MNCPDCDSEFAYQPLIGPPECPNNKCKFHTIRQEDESVELFLERIGKETKKETAPKEIDKSCSVSMCDDLSAWSAWAGLDYSGD